MFVEDTYDELYKIAWLKIFNISHDKNNFQQLFLDKSPFSIFRAEGAGPLAGFLRTKNIDFYKDKKIIGLFDFDEEGVKQFISVKNEAYWKTDILGIKSTGLYKKRDGHSCFTAMLIPVPEALNGLADLDYPSFVEIENLLPATFLLENSFANETITTGDTKYLKIKSDKKSKIWEKVLELNQTDLSNFETLFKTIYSIFSLPTPSQES